MSLQRKITALPDYPSSACAEARELSNTVLMGKESLTDLLDAPQGEVIQDLNASRLLARLIDFAAHKSPGTKMITTALDHPAAVDAVLYSAARTGKQAIIVPINEETHSIDQERIISMIDKNTAVLVMTYTSNTTGAVLPVAGIVRATKIINPKAIVIIDGVQKLPHGAVSLSQFEADALVLAPYKVFSARGSGLAWISPRLHRLHQDHYKGLAQRSWETGSLDPVSYGCVKAVADYFAWLGSCFTDATDRRTLIAEGQKRVEAHEHILLNLLLSGSRGIPGLRELKGVRLHFDPPAQNETDLIISISIPALDGGEALSMFAQRGVILSLRKRDSVYCHRVLEHYNLDWVLRISPMHYHTPEEMERFLMITSELADQHAR